MTKNEAKRPNIKSIFCDPFIKKIMQDFIDTGGKNIKSNPIPIKKTMTHNEIKEIIEANKSTLN